MTDPNTMSRYCLATLALAASSGCAGFIEKRAADSTYSVMQRSSVAVQRASDVELARAAAPGGLVQLEAFHLAYPNHRGFVELLAEGYCQYASGFLHDDWEELVLAGDTAGADRVRDRTLNLLDQCVHWGLRLLDDEWKQAYDAGPAELDARIAGADDDDVAGMSWVAVGMVTSIGMNPMDPQRMRYLPTADKLLERIVELAPAHRDAMALVMLGALDSSRPAFLGGDPDAGERHFERARELTRGEVLVVDVVFARTYAVAVKDRTLFRETLERVVEANTARWPERRLTNEMAIQKARMYLDAEAALFGDPPAEQPEAEEDEEDEEDEEAERLSHTPSTPSSSR